MDTKYKFLTHLTLYRFGAELQKDTITIDWFLLASDPDIRVDQIVRAFSYDEMTRFQRYAVTNSVNFPHTKEYQISSDEEAFLLEGDGILPLLAEGHPPYVTLRMEPKIQPHRTSLASDIILCDASGRPAHAYDLPFNVIGKVRY